MMFTVSIHGLGSWELRAVPLHPGNLVELFFFSEAKTKEKKVCLKCLSAPLRFSLLGGIDPIELPPFRVYYGRGCVCTLSYSS